MAADRRVVSSLDWVLRSTGPTARGRPGPRGRAIGTDFLVLDLLAIVERFATDFDGLPEIVEGVPQASVLIATGRLVRAVAVYGLLVTDAVLTCSA